MKTSTSRAGYLVSAFLGAVAGGIFVAAITKMGPKMMAAMMSSMMESRISKMGENGCSPEEM